jgi:hypothetical protein
MVSGLAAGLIAGVHPLPAWMSARVMSDEFYGVCGWFGLAALVSVLPTDRRDTRRWVWVSAAVLLLAVHFLTRSSSLLTAALVVVLLLVQRPVRKPLAAVVLCLALVPALGWSVRTSLLEGRPVFVHSLVACNFWIGEAQYRLGLEERRGQHRLAGHRLVLEKAGLETDEVEHFWYGELTPSELGVMEPRLARAAVHRVLNEPFDYAQRVIVGSGRFWFAGYTERRTIQYAAAVTPVLFFASLGLLCFRVESVRKDALAWLSVGSILLHNLAYAAVLPYARYSVAVYVPLAYIAGIGVWQVVRWWEVRRCPARAASR